MTCVLVALLAAAPCELPPGHELTEVQHAAICSLPTSTPATTTREGLLAIYERPGFEKARTPEAGDTLKRLRAWLESLFETAGAEAYSNITRVVVLVVAAIAAVALVIRLAGRRRVIASAPSSLGATNLDLADPSVHLERARGLLTTAPRDAAREGLLAILSALERQRFARPDRVKTNREIVDELPSRGAPPAIVEAVRSQLSWFDRAWYSLRPLDAPEATQFVDEADRLVLQVNAGSTEPRP